MPKQLKQLDREAYCSAPPLSTSAVQPPRLTRKAEASRPRAPIHAPVDCKAEISSLESVEFVADEDYYLKPRVKVELDPRMRTGIAALPSGLPRQKHLPGQASPQQQPQDH